MFDLHVCMYVYCMYVWCPWRSEGGIKYLVTEVLNGYEAPYGCWGSNPIPLQGQHISKWLSHLSSPMYLLHLKTLQQEFYLCLCPSSLPL